MFCKKLGLMYEFVDRAHSIYALQRVNLNCKNCQLLHNCLVIMNLSLGAGCVLQELRGEAGLDVRIRK